jgi:putative restriction endonuclease
MAGIWGTLKSKSGAVSIVLSGGYEDDIDDGDEIIYTGKGGQDPKTKKQVADQEMKEQNEALARNMNTGYPVRVIRGYQGDSKHSPSSGYRYDGLFRVEDVFWNKGIAGFQMLRFKLVQLADQDAGETKSGSEAPSGQKKPKRKKGSTVRIIRDTALSRWVKKQNDYICQFCEERLETPTGPYAEGAHIKQLGMHHKGPDVKENILCLCPNCHLLFDRGALGVSSEGVLIGQAAPEPQRFILTDRHSVSEKYLKYHRETHRLHDPSSTTPGARGN